MASPSAVDVAVLAVLKTDAALTALLPDGVHWMTAPAGARRFVRLEQAASAATYGFSETLHERYVYDVRAVALATESALVDDGADRIDALLHDQPLTIAGYDWMATLRLTRLRDTEIDPMSADTRWQQGGARSEVWVSPQ